jgi:arylsulfatase A-like enzyme
MQGAGTPIDQALWSAGQCTSNTACTAPSCVANTDCSAVGQSCDKTCKYRGLYLGGIPEFNPCDADEAVGRKNAYCCYPPATDETITGSNAVGENADNYVFHSGLYTPDGKKQAWNSTAAWPCSKDDGNAIKAGCNYDTRIVRDFAKNFIRRHAKGRENDDPFFLELTFHATHSAHQAPPRTVRHYKASNPPDRPDVNYWAVVEELDAAIGEILHYMEGFCLGNGQECTPGGSLPAGCGECMDVSEETLLIFTTDQGRPGGGFGDPVLRGGKENLFEGGMRAGLIARMPGTIAGGKRIGGDTHTLAGHVDIFPSLVRAADESSAAPTTAIVPGATVDRKLDGVDVWEDLKDPDPASTPRDILFAQYHTQKAAVARTGFQVQNDSNQNVPLGMCGYRDIIHTTDAAPTSTRVVCNPEDSPAGEANTACTTNGDCSGGTCVGYLTRNVRGGALPAPPGTSSDGNLCNPATDSCTDRWCKLEGKYCVTGTIGTGTCPSNAAYACTAQQCTQKMCKYDTVNLSWKRCRGTKGCDGHCVPLLVKCNECIEASWKLLTSGVATPEHLYELNTNPEEDPALNYKSADTANACATNVECIQDELHARLDDWQSCDVNADCSCCANGTDCTDDGQCH